MVAVRKKILCIEDDRQTASALSRHLSKRGYAVTFAHDGLEAISLILRAEPNLVLCDLGTLDMSGLELIDRLVAYAARLGRVPFVFLASLPLPGGEFRGRPFNEIDHVTKPIDWGRLDAVVTERLFGLAPTGAAILSEREVEMLTWSARGKSSAEIAQLVGLTKRTVDFHIDNARIKLGAKTRVEAATRAAASRLIKP